MPWWRSNPDYFGHDFNRKARLREAQRAEKKEREEKARRAPKVTVNGRKYKPE